MDKRNFLRIATLCLTVLLVLTRCARHAPDSGSLEAGSPADASGFVSLAETVPDVILQLRGRQDRRLRGTLRPHDP